MEIVKPYLIISACLARLCCRYDGQESKKLGDDVFRQLSERYSLLPICPEQLGGLPTPRPPAEIINDRVMTEAGDDVTAQYQRGAREVCRLAKRFACSSALLKARSPSCGCGAIYDGSFSGRLVPGDGICAGLLKSEGIAVFSELNADELL